MESVSRVAAAPAATELGAKAPTSNKTLCHTPFGDVMVDELATTDLAGLFGTKTPAVATPAPAAPAVSVLKTAPDPHSIPTAQSVFGDQVWLDSPTGAGPSDSHWNYNPTYFATRATAEKIAAMIGGTVVEANALAPNGPMRQQVPNQMIQLPDGRQVNAGLIADFYNHGYPQYYVDQMVQNEIRGA